MLLFADTQDAALMIDRFVGLLTAVLPIS